MSKLLHFLFSHHAFDIDIGNHFGDADRSRTTTGVVGDIETFHRLLERAAKKKKLRYVGKVTSLITEYINEKNARTVWEGYISSCTLDNF